jgi:hypothetical protein
MLDCIVAAAALGVWAPAGAQTTADPNANPARHFAASEGVQEVTTPPRDNRALDEVRRKLTPGQTIYVLDTLSRETQGVLISVLPASLRLGVGSDERDIAWNEIQQVARRGDSAADGALVGALIMAGVYVAPAIATDQPGAILWGAAIGAGIGALIDGAISGKTVVYRAPEQPTMTVVPVVLPGRASVRLALRF